MRQDELFRSRRGCVFLRGPADYFDWGVDRADTAPLPPLSTPGIHPDRRMGRRPPHGSTRYICPLLRKALVKSTARGEASRPQGQCRQDGACGRATGSEAERHRRPQAARRFLSSISAPTVVLARATRACSPAISNRNIAGSRTRTLTYHVPLYRVPGDFNARNPTSRRQIEQGARDGRGLELVYLNSRGRCILYSCPGIGTQ